MQRRRRVLLGLVVLVVVLLLLWWGRRDGGGPRVDVVQVEHREVFRSTVTASGEIIASRWADIGSSIMGRVVELLVAEGASVRQGQVVARIDAAQASSAAEAAAALVDALEAEELAARERWAAARAQLERDRARAEEAAKSLERTGNLHAEGVVATAALDAARAEADATRAQLEAARAETASAEKALRAAALRVAQARAQAAGARDLLGKTEILAPMDGQVTRLDVREGEMVVVGIQNQPGTILMTISDLASLDAEVKVAEADVLRLALGQPATVTLEALPDTVFTGRVHEIGASALPVEGTGAAAREFRVVVLLDDPDPRLRPGLTCDAEIVTAEKRGVRTLPLQAVVLRGGEGEADERTGVFVAQGTVARFQPVTPGIIGGIDVEVAGLEDGASVVVGPFQVLRQLEDGQRIRPTPLEPR